MPKLVLQYGWRDRAPKGKSCWSLTTEGETIIEIELPTDRILKRLYNESFKIRDQPLEVLKRFRWGCILRTPSGISRADRRRFLDAVMKHPSTEIQ